LEENLFMPETDEEDNWTTEIDSKYRLVLLAAKRSKQLQRGAKPRIYSSAKKTTRIALEEVRRGLVRYQPLVKPLKAE
jgi:DNA-directed RNA polymerase subunit omega